MQLKVKKADGSMQPYLHTKVIAAFVNAFSQQDCGNSAFAETLAETVTYYLYNQRKSRVVNSCEIFSVIKAVLCSTGHQAEAINLETYHYSRILKRSRVKIISSGSEPIDKTMTGKSFPCENYLSSWDKSIIVKTLISEYNMDAATAGTVASMVEEKVLNCNIYYLPSSFIKFLVASQAKAILSAQKLLADGTAGRAGGEEGAKMEETAETNADYNTARDGRLRQPQNGLCPVAI